MSQAQITARNPSPQWPLGWAAGDQFNGYRSAGLYLGNIKPRNERLGFCLEWGALFWFYLKVKSHDGVFVDGDAGIANRDYGRCSGFSASQNITCFTTPAKLINERGTPRTQQNDTGADAKCTLFNCSGIHHDDTPQRLN